MLSICADQLRLDDPKRLDISTPGSDGAVPAKAPAGAGAPPEGDAAAAGVVPSKRLTPL